MAAHHRQPAPCPNGARARRALCYGKAMRVVHILAASLLALAGTRAPAQELPVGQSEADYQAWLAADPGHRGQTLSFEAWQRAAGVLGVVPTWQLIRTASLWRECQGPPFEIPPFRLWPGMAQTLRFVRDHVRPALGPVEAVSGYRNPALKIGRAS